MDEMERTRDVGAELQGNIDKLHLERERKQRAKQFDAKLLELANKAVDFRLKYGQDNYLTELMVTFLDVGLQLKEVVEVLTAVNIAMECLSDAIGFIDAAINFDQNLFEDSMQTKHGVFARWKRRRQAKRAIRNNVGRVKSIIEGIIMKYRMALDITTALKTSCVKLQKSMNSRSITDKKKNLTKGSGKSFGTPSGAQQMIAEIMKERGITAEGADGTGASDASGASGAPSDGVSNIDDIL